MPVHVDDALGQGGLLLRVRVRLLRVRVRLLRVRVRLLRRRGKGLPRRWRVALRLLLLLLG